METCLGNLQLQWCIFYLHDVIVFAASPKEPLERFCTVLSLLWSAGLNFQPAKCELFKVSVVYLGHEISKEGVCTDMHNIKAIRNLSVPIMVTELRSF